MAKRNYEKLSKRQYNEQLTYRDVHESQQMDRGKPQEESTMTTGYVATVICTVFAVGFSYVIVKALGGFVELGLWLYGIPAFIGVCVAFGVYLSFSRIRDIENAMIRTDDINQHYGDQHIAFLEELFEQHDIFPDAGAVSNVQPATMISHAFVTNKGINKVEVPVRHEKDIIDNDTGKVITYKGEIKFDEDTGEPLTKKVPLFDTNFGNELFTVSGVPDDKSVRKFIDIGKIPYNPKGANRDKMKYETCGDLINQEWYLPGYEPQRPAGVYIVDTAPVNTLIVAMTRAGKGQTYIEVMIDMWMRVKRPNNMVINDPKGELLVKNYVAGTVRGFDIVQFNLINPLRTHVYNPLGMVVKMALAGDEKECSALVENICGTFFPEGGDDPMWSTAAANATKRSIYGLIDYFFEEEREYRAKVIRENISREEEATYLDKMWGQVSLYNVYQMFVRLTAKKIQNPLNALIKQKDVIINEQGEAAFERMFLDAKARSELFNGAAELDLLSVYFAASDMLPRSKLRTLAGDANNSLKSMGAAEKMLASVYGIAVTNLAFFTDPTIRTLTSGTLSQNVDLAGLSFPRRIGVRLHAEYITKRSLLGLSVVWTAYEDKAFTKPLGKEFHHTDIIQRSGWCMYCFEGICKKEKMYLRLEIRNPQTDLLVDEFFFEFEKKYRTTLNGRSYVTDPVLGTRIVDGGYIRDMMPDLTGEYIFKRPTFTRFAVTDVFEEYVSPEMVDQPIFVQTDIAYNERQKMVFLVTPPHLMSYAKLLLILLKQMVDKSFAQAYLTKDNQKPLYKTQFMLDELGFVNTLRICNGCVL